MPDWNAALWAGVAGRAAIALGLGVYLIKKRDAGTLLIALGLVAVVGSYFFRPLSADELYERQYGPREATAVLDHVKSASVSDERFRVVYSRAILTAGGAVGDIGSDLRTVAQWVMRKPDERLPAGGIRFEVYLPTRDIYGASGEQHAITLSWDAATIRKMALENISGWEVANLATLDYTSLIMRRPLIEMCTAAGADMALFCGQIRH